jgi:hypothetical protein
MTDSPHAQAHLGRYLLFKSLKKGGMARVFLAIDPERPDELLAVKTLLPKLRNERVYREMFASEGKVGVRLQHPHIVRTLDHGVERGTPYIAMEFIFGFDVSTILRTLRTAEREMPVALAVGLARDVADALHYAHALVDESGRPLDIVNRDVSPGNIMVGFEGRVRLIDFGIAQTTIDVKSQIGSIKGKISYMAPEQVRGLPVDHRVDLFGLGTVLYEMLTGLQPFHDEGDFATMEKVREAVFDPASGLNRAVDARLDAIVAKALAREVHDRYAQAGEMRDDLAGWLAARGEVVGPEVFAGFMRRLFEQRIGEMTADIEAAKRAAVGGVGPRVPSRVSTASGSLRLISDDMLDEFVGLTTDTDLPPARAAAAAAASRPSGLAGLAGSSGGRLSGRTEGGRSRWMWALVLVGAAAVGGLLWALWGM